MNTFVSGIGKRNNKITGQVALHIERVVLLVGDVLPPQRAFEGVT